MRRRRVPWPGSAASRSVSRCLPLRARDSLPVRPLSSVPNPRPGHPLPPHLGTDLPLPAQAPATLCPPNHHPPEVPLHHPRGGFGGRMRQRRAPVRQDPRTRTRARTKPVMRRSLQPRPHQHPPHLCPHPPQPNPRRSSPRPRSLQVGMDRGSKEASFACVGEVVRGMGPEMLEDWVLGDRKRKPLPSESPGPEHRPDKRTSTLN